MQPCESRPHKGFANRGPERPRPGRESGKSRPLGYKSRSDVRIRASRAGLPTHPNRRSVPGFTRSRQPDFRGQGRLGCPAGLPPGRGLGCVQLSRGAIRARTAGVEQLDFCCVPGRLLGAAGGFGNDRTTVTA